MGPPSGLPYANMSRELTNLLPHTRVAAFRRRYFLRVASVALILLCVLVVMHALLLLPSYFYARDQVRQHREVLGTEWAVAELSEEQEVEARKKLLAATVADLAKLEKAPAASDAIRAVLAVPRPGVAISGFTFVAPAGSGNAKLGITGMAASRDSLRQYVTALGQLPFVTSADLPISAYAKEADIAFTITLTGPLLP